MTIINLEDPVAKWFEMDGGGRVQLRVLSVAEFKAIQKKTTRKKVDYRRVEGVAGRFEYEESDTDLQNELYWDAVIVDWENIVDKKGDPIPCTRENKVLVMSRSRKFLDFVVESLRVVTEDESRQQEEDLKN